MFEEIEALKDKIWDKVYQGENEIIFENNEYSAKLYHAQDCCEYVYIEDVCGDLNDLVGNPILIAEERSDSFSPEYGESGTWTFYVFATIKGHVTIRWLGTSNGYYSESVNFRINRK